MNAARGLPLLALVLLAPTLVRASQAQPVPVPEEKSTEPQLQISGVGIATLRSSAGGGGAGFVPGIDFSDGEIQVGAAQRLYGGGLGSAGFGVLTQEGGGLFLNQAFVDDQSERFEAVIGRTDNATAHLVDFPTLRGDDLVTLTHPLNPLSNGVNPEEHRYANVASFTFNQALQFYENIHAQQLIDGSEDARLNAFGATFQYLAPPGQEHFQRIASLGAAYEYLDVESGGSRGLHQVTAGGVVGLNESVTNRWELRFQDIVSLGSGLSSLAGAVDSHQADSNAVAFAVRYVDSPFGQPGASLALTLGYKEYFQVAHAASAGAALTAVKRLGQGFDAVAQVSAQWRDEALARVQSEGEAFERSVEVGLHFNFDATLNPHLSPRRSILNLEHGYISD